MKWSIDWLAMFQNWRVRRFSFVGKVWNSVEGNVGKRLLWKLYLHFTGVKRAVLLDIVSKIWHRWCQYDMMECAIWAIFAQEKFGKRPDISYANNRCFNWWIIQQAPRRYCQHLWHQGNLVKNLHGDITTCFLFRQLPSIPRLCLS